MQQEMANVKDEDCLQNFEKLHPCFVQLTRIDEKSLCLKCGNTKTVGCNCKRIEVLKEKLHDTSSEDEELVKTKEGKEKWSETGRNATESPLIFGQSFKCRPSNKNTYTMHIKKSCFFVAMDDTNIVASPLVPESCFPKPNKDKIGVSMLNTGIEEDCLIFDSDEELEPQEMKNTVNDILFNLENEIPPPENTAETKNVNNLKRKKIDFNDNHCQEVLDIGKIHFPTTFNNKALKTQSVKEQDTKNKGKHFFGNHFKTEVVTNFEELKKNSNYYKDFNLIPCSIVLSRSDIKICENFDILTGNIVGIREPSGIVDNSEVLETNTYFKASDKDTLVQTIITNENNRNLAENTKEKLNESRKISELRTLLKTCTVVIPKLNPEELSLQYSKIGKAKSPSLNFLSSKLDAKVMENKDKGSKSQLCFKNKHSETCNIFVNIDNKAQRKSSETEKKTNQNEYVDNKSKLNTIFKTPNTSESVFLRNSMNYNVTKPCKVFIKKLPFQYIESTVKKTTLSIPASTFLHNKENKRDYPAKEAIKNNFNDKQLNNPSIFGLKNNEKLPNHIKKFSCIPCSVVLEKINSTVYNSTELTKNYSEVQHAMKVEVKGIKHSSEKRLFESEENTRNKARKIETSIFNSLQVIDDREIVNASECAMSDNEDNLTVVCIQCNKTLLSKRLFYYHKCFGKRENGFLCYICEKIFETENLLLCHQKLHFQ